MRWLAVLLFIKTVLGASENPEENRGIHDPNLFEGDMYLTPRQRYKAEHGMDVDSDLKRGSSRLRLWPGGVVPYTISPSLARNPRAMAAIRLGISEWTRKTCIRLIPRKRGEAAYVSFIPGSGCASYVGRIGNRQFIWLAQGCWTTGIVAHEIGHAVGFYHEQSRPDRDRFVQIVWSNIQPDYFSAFKKYPKSIIDSLRTPYDYRSVMHYGRNAFSKNGKPTIIVKRREFQNVIGQRFGLSRIDALQANRLYSCLGRGGGRSPGTRRSRKGRGGKRSGRRRQKGRRKLCDAKLTSSSSLTSESKDDSPIANPAE